MQDTPGLSHHNEHVSECLNLNLFLHAFYEQQRKNALAQKTGMTIPAVVVPTTLTKWVHVW